MALADIGAATTTVMLVNGDSAVTREEPFDLSPDTSGGDFAGSPASGRAIEASTVDAVLALLTPALASRTPGEPFGVRGQAAACWGRCRDTRTRRARGTERLGVAVEVADAFHGMAVSARADRASLTELAPALFTASGLAVRGFAET